MSFWEKGKRLLGSRKFWALVAGIVTAAGAQATGQITTWEMVQAIVAALAVYSGAIAYVDGQAEAGKSLPAVVSAIAAAAPPAVTNSAGEE